MKKSIVLFSLLCLLKIQAQKELWGVNTGYQYVNLDYPGYKGNITKYDINGENPVIVHEFDSINGHIPNGRLFQASNGKLYGTTLLGGNLGALGANTTAGVLFEYDLIINKYRVVKYFDYNFTPPNTPAVNPYIGVIEPTNGILCGATSDRIYKYDIANNLIVFSNPIGFQNVLFAELMKASDGFIYTTSTGGNCPNGISNEPYQGNIIKYNTNTNNLNSVFSFFCNTGLGAFPIKKLTEFSLGKLYGTTNGGGLYFLTNPFLRGGTIFEFNITTGAFSNKINFSNSISGVNPLELVNGDNGKIYGLCSEGGAPQSCNPDYNFGTLFEYTPATNAFEVKQYFNFCGNTVLYPSFFMKTSLGHFIGTIPNGGLFKYDATTNVITMPDYSNVDSTMINAVNNSNLIEICRKPSYQEILINNFNPCAGSTFTYNVQNSNATSYLWKKGVTALPTQTTAILNLENLTAGDNGVYTCTMVNECGTTITMPLTLTVDCLSINEIENYKNNITLYPNPTKGNLNIKIPEQNNLTVSSVSISNMLGQLVYSDSLNRNLGTTKITVDVTKLEIGIYNVFLKTDKGDWNGKFVKN